MVNFMFIYISLQFLKINKRAESAEQPASHRTLARAQGKFPLWLTGPRARPPAVTSGITKSPPHQQTVTERLLGPRLL